MQKISMKLLPFTGDFVSWWKGGWSENGGRPNFIYSVRSFVDCNLQLFTMFTGLRSVLLKEVYDWPKRVVGHPLPCVVEIRSYRITFTPMGLGGRGYSDRRLSFYELLAQLKFVWMPPDYPQRRSLFPFQK